MLPIDNEPVKLFSDLTYCPEAATSWPRRGSVARTVDCRWAASSAQTDQRCNEFLDQAWTDYESGGQRCFGLPCASQKIGISNGRMGKTAKNSRKALTSELPPITDMVWPRGNAPLALLVPQNRFRVLKKSQMVRRDFSRRVPETFAIFDGRMAYEHPDGRG